MDNIKRNIRKKQGQNENQVISLNNECNEKIEVVKNIAVQS